MLTPPATLEELEPIAADALALLWGSPITALGLGEAERTGVHFTGTDREAGGGIAGALLVAGGKPLATREIKDVVARAEQRQPPLVVLWVLMPIPTDTLSQEQFRRVSTAHHQRHLFHVKPLYWDQIVRALASDAAMRVKYGLEEMEAAPAPKLY